MKETKCTCIEDFDKKNIDEAIASGHEHYTFINGCRGLNMPNTMTEFRCCIHDAPNQDIEDIIILSDGDFVSMVSGCFNDNRFIHPYLAIDSPNVMIGWFKGGD